MTEWHDEMTALNENDAPDFHTWINFASKLTLKFYKSYDNFFL